MPTWLALVLLLNIALTLYLMGAAVPALWSREMRLRSGGRTLHGPLAQFCGLLMLAPLVLSLITGGEVAYRSGVRPKPEPTEPKYDSGSQDESEDPWRQTRAAGKKWLYGTICDFALFAIPFDVLVWSLIILFGRTSLKQCQLPRLHNGSRRRTGPDFH